MTAVERLALQALHHQSIEAVERSDVDRYDAFNRDFHSAFYLDCVTSHCHIW